MAMKVGPARWWAAPSPVTLIDFPVESAINHGPAKVNETPTTRLRPFGDKLDLSRTIATFESAACIILL
jgi:hypothetical protein